MTPCEAPLLVPASEVSKKQRLTRLYAVRVNAKAKERTHRTVKARMCCQETRTSSSLSWAACCSDGFSGRRIHD